MRGAVAANRTPSAADNAPRVGIVRGLPNTYEMDSDGRTFSTNPLGGWVRGQVERAAMQPFAPPPPVPMYDPTLMAHPEAWGA